MKLEFEFREGKFIALSPKTYYSISNNGDVKMGSKGIPHKLKLRMDQYEQALFTTNRHRVTVNSLRVCNGKMARTSQNKLGLSDIFVKYRVMDDGITCKPLSVNGKIL